MYELLAALREDADPYTILTPPTWLTQVKEQLIEAYDQPCSVRTLAAKAGVHPVYLTRLFRRHYRCSVTEYLKQRRVKAVAHGLASTKKPLVNLALETGFSDQSHMSRVFKSEMGFTPRRFRMLTQNA